MKLSQLTTSLREGRVMKLKHEDYQAITDLLKNVYHSFPAASATNWEEVGSVATLNKFQHEQLKMIPELLNQIKTVVLFLTKLVTTERLQIQYTDSTINIQDAVTELTNIGTNLTQVMKILAKYGITLEEFKKVKMVIDAVNKAATVAKALITAPTAPQAKPTHPPAPQNQPQATAKPGGPRWQARLAASQKPDPFGFAP